MEDQILGMLAGVALGDSLGSPWERGYQALRFMQNRNLYTGILDTPIIATSQFQGKRTSVIGQVSDDTEMTIALAESIIRKKGYDREDVLLSYMDFANQCSFLGINTRALFYGVKTVKGYEKRTEKIFPNGSEGNGSLMRASPLCIFKSDENAITDCGLSNPSKRNISISKCYHELLRSNDLADYEYPDYSEKVNSKDKGWVKIPFYLYLQTRELKTFREVIDAVIRYGGDCDTNAAIVGAIHGKYHGFEKMMEDPVTKNNWEIIINAKTEEGDFPRPGKYHPKNIPRIASELAKLYQE